MVNRLLTRLFNHRSSIIDHRFKWLLKGTQEANNRTVRHNFHANIWDGALFAFGLSVASLTTVLPVFVKRIGGGSVAIALIVVVWNIVTNFPQIFVAHFVQRYPYKKKIFLFTALLQRLPWLLMGLLAFATLKVSSDVALPMFFVIFALAAFGGSLTVPSWFDMISKLTPVKLRGRLFSLRALFGAILGVCGGFLVKFILDTISFPNNFALLFLLAFMAFMGSYYFLTVLEEELPSHATRLLNQKDYLSHLLVIVKSDRNFRNYLVADALMMLAMVADAFYSVNALERFSLSDGYIGQFTVTIMISSIVGNLFFGLMADRYGHKLNLMLAAAFTVLAGVFAIVAPTIEFYYLVFICFSFVTALKHVSRLTIISELCRERDRPVYVSLSNMVSSPFLLFAILVGWLADRLGYDLIFLMTGFFALASAIWLMKKVDEPRHLDLKAVVRRPQLNV
jgi:MFS family permease